MKRRFLSLFLTLILILSLLPVSGINIARAAAGQNIWVGGTEITDENAADVFGDGTVSYDLTTRTLFLDGYTYTGQGWKNGSAFYGIYIGASGDVTIHLIGENRIDLHPRR